VTRRKYLFDLAAICHVPPPVVNALTVADFAQLVVSVDQYKAELRKGGV
jgi:hypothetical protein